MAIALIQRIALVLFPILPLVAAAETRLPALEAEIAGDAFPMGPEEGSPPTHVRMWNAQDGALTWRPQLEQAGLYEIAFEVATPFGTKGYGVEIAGVVHRGFFRGTVAEFTERPAILVELEAGENVITLRQGWGHYDVRSLVLRRATAPFPRPADVPPELSNPAATAEAQALFDRLRAGYGQRTISGQYRTFGQADFAEADYVERVTGARPLIYGADLMPFSPAFAEREATPVPLVEEMIAAAQRGHIISLMWHWTMPVPDGVPYYKGFNTHPGGFDAAAAVMSGNPEHARFLAGLDALAPVLRRFQEAGVPVLWRPLHEPESRAFWWGSAGPEVYRELWRLTWERLVDHHGLHHLIWVYSPAELVELEWYPGDELVDIIAPDLYPEHPEDSLADAWWVLFKRFNGKKMLGLGEIGGAPDLPRLHALGVHWAFYLSWTESLGPTSLDPDQLRRAYQAPGALNWQSVK